MAGYRVATRAMMQCDSYYIISDPILAGFQGLIRCNVHNTGNAGIMAVGKQ